MFDKKVTKEYEECVVCHKKLNIDKNTHISQREHYIVGTGQLCRDCYLKFFDKRKAEGDF